MGLDYYKANGTKSCAVLLSGHCYLGLLGFCFDSGRDRLLMSTPVIEFFLLVYHVMLFDE